MAIVIFDDEEEEKKLNKHSCIPVFLTINIGSHISRRRPFTSNVLVFILRKINYLVDNVWFFEKECVSDIDVNMHHFFLRRSITGE